MPRPVPGVRPGGRPTSLGAQRSRQENRPEETAHPLGGCPAMLEAQGRAELTSRSEVQTSVAKSELEACFARALGFCASRRFLRGSSETAEQLQQPTAKPESRSQRGIPLAPFEPAEKRRALSPRAKLASTSDSRRLFEQSVAARVRRAGSRTEHRRGPLAQRGAGGSGGALCLLSGGPESRSPAGAKSRHHSFAPTKLWSRCPTSTPSPAPPSAH
jgi:hypothetical protein